MNKSNKTNLRPKKTTRKEQELLDQQNLEYLKKRDSLLVVESSFLNAAVTETFGKSLLLNIFSFIQASICSYIGKSLLKSIVIFIYSPLC